MSLIATYQSPAKINVYLQVGQLRDDGFHDVTTVYQAVGMYDTVTISASDSVRITGGGPNDKTNLVWRAVEELCRLTHRNVPTFAVHIDKKIPIAAGLAGGSTDAAAMLKFLSHYWKIEPEIVIAAAQNVGSDVPFLLHGGMGLGTGRGEVVTPILHRGTFHWVIVADHTQLSTPRVYRELDRIRAQKLLPQSSYAVSPDQIIAAVAQGSPEYLASCMINDLQPAAISLVPKLRKTLDTGLRCGALAGLVSGSGPTCIFLAYDGAHARKIATSISHILHQVSINVVSAPVGGAQEYGKSYIHT